MAGFENFGLEHGQLVDAGRIPHFSELSEHYPDDVVMLLDQQNVKLKGITPDQQHWRDNGYVIKRNFIPHDLLDEYARIRQRLDLGVGPFKDITPYLNHSVIRDICCSPELHRLMTDLVGEELGLHFILADYKSTERGWHQDDYLNPEHTYARYAAVWMAMEDIDLDSGPFEFVPGSHKWPCMRNGKVKDLVIPEIRDDGTHHWAVAAEYLVNKSVDDYIRETGSKVERFYAKKGDILVWHGKLMHRGSIPNNPALLRPAMIAHYSAVRQRRDFSSEVTRHLDGGYYWEFGYLGRPLTEDQFDRAPAAAPAPSAPAAGGLRPRPAIARYLSGMKSRLRELLPQG